MRDNPFQRLLEEMAPPSRTNPLSDAPLQGAPLQGLPAHLGDPALRGLAGWVEQALTERTRDQEFEMAQLQERLRLLERTLGPDGGHSRIRTELAELQGWMDRLIETLRDDHRHDVEQAAAELRIEQAQGLSRLRFEILRHVLQETQQQRRATEQARAEMEEIRADSCSADLRLQSSLREARALIEELSLKLAEQGRTLERSEAELQHLQRVRGQVADLQAWARRALEDLRGEYREALLQLADDLRQDRQRELDRTRAPLQGVAGGALTQGPVQVDRILEEARATIETLTRRLEERVGSGLDLLSMEMDRKVDLRLQELGGLSHLPAAISHLRDPLPALPKHGEQPAAAPVLPLWRAAAPLPQANREVAAGDGPSGSAPALDEAPPLDEARELLEERLLQMWVEDRLAGVEDSWEDHRARFEELRVAGPSTLEATPERSAEPAPEQGALELQARRDLRLAEELEWLWADEAEAADTDSAVA